MNTAVYVILATEAIAVLLEARAVLSLFNSILRH